MHGLCAFGGMGRQFNVVFECVYMRVLDFLGNTNCKLFTYEPAFIGIWDQSEHLAILQRRPVQINSKIEENFRYQYRKEGKVVEDVAQRPREHVVQSGSDMQRDVVDLLLSLKHGG